MAVDRSRRGMAGATLRPGEFESRSARKIENGTVISESFCGEDGSYHSQEYFVPGGPDVPGNGGTRSGGADARPNGLRRAIRQSLKSP